MFQTGRTSKTKSAYVTLSRQMSVRVDVLITAELFFKKNEKSRDDGGVPPPRPLSSKNARCSWLPGFVFKGRSGAGRPIKPRARPSPPFASAAHLVFSSEGMNCWSRLA
ncbi:UNVERIFIED_CONTAM: hypothetical protein K2H54_034017 [Gekko kuhli]